PERKGRMKLYVKRVFITDDADLLPRYLRFVRGLVDTADLPLNVSREMIQESPILAAIRKGITSRIITAIEKVAESDADAFLKFWENFGAVLKEGIYEDFERRAQLLALARFRTSSSNEGYRSLADYVKDAKEGQNAVYYVAGGSLDQLKASPQLEGFRARGIEVLLLSDSIDSFWTMNAPDYEGKAFKSITQGAADLAQFAKLDGQTTQEAEDNSTATFLVFAKQKLADQIADVRASDRLTESAVCLVAPEDGYDRQMEKILRNAGRLQDASKPILEINLLHPLIKAIASVEGDASYQEDAAFLLLDQARILDGDRPADPRRFAERLARVFQRSVQS
ncbi:molecular chaperone HtpG, partial [Rhizobium laguerreae]|nr:molecular chaperone HtpG [Rhizobium laguerreae]